MGSSGFGGPPTCPPIRTAHSREQDATVLHLLLAMHVSPKARTPPAAILLVAPRPARLRGAGAALWGRGAMERACALSARHMCAHALLGCSSLQALAQDRCAPRAQMLLCKVWGPGLHVGERPQNSSEQLAGGTRLSRTLGPRLAHARPCRVAEGPAPNLRPSARRPRYRAP